MCYKILFNNKIFWNRSITVLPMAHQRKKVRSLTMSLLVLPVSMRVLSGFSSFLSHSRKMHVRQTGKSKLCCRIEHECQWLSVSLCGPAIIWKPVQNVAPPSPEDSCDRFQYAPKCGRRGFSKWKNEWIADEQSLPTKRGFSLSLHCSLPTSVIGVFRQSHTKGQHVFRSSEFVCVWVCVRTHMNQP